MKNYRHILGILTLCLIPLLALADDYTCGRNLVDVNIVSPTDSSGPVEIMVQDQHTRILDLYFIKAVGAPTTLAVATTPDTYTFTVADSTGFVDGNYIGIFCPSGEFFFAHQIGAPAGNVITVDTPIDVTAPIGCNVLRLTKNMAVDGSATRQIFQIGPVGGSTGIEVDITRTSGRITDQTAMDDSLFGGISPLPKGIVLRVNNGIIQNIWNAKTNGDLALICAGDFDYASRAPSGFFGGRFRNTFSGQEKHGVTVRLEPGDTLELLIQDNLTGLDLFEMMAQGHFVTD
jgi:hypothetical protein